ncbi:MAG TPA: glycosyltransferase family 4 protein [Patescibacteria group bacterium]|nr:glycosyltransferase family 4 protein [Patescibacteria group bacterium]
MKILFLTQVLPYPLFGGAKVRAYYVLRYLAREHDITLVSFIRSDDQPEDLEHLREYCEQVHTIPIGRNRLKDILALIESFITGQPAVVIRDRISGMRRLLKDLVLNEQYDVIHADQTSMAEYALFAQSQADKIQLPKILLDEHNALHHVVQRQAEYEAGYSRWLYNREAGLLAKYERKLLRYFDHILTVTEEDRETLLKLFTDDEGSRIAQRMSVVPICIDTEAAAVVNQAGERPQVVHLGTMFWPPNIEAVQWFTKEVLPLVIGQVPHVRFVIAGKDPPASVRNLAGNKSEYGDWVDVLGFVREPDKLIAASQVFVVPVQAGGGMRVKILDAWSWGIPVISTTIGAEGIRIVPGKNILIADDPNEFAALVVRALLDKELAARLVSEGRGWVSQHYNWQSTYKAVDEVYRQLVNRQVNSRNGGPDL